MSAIAHLCTFTKLLEHSDWDLKNLKIDPTSSDYILLFFTVFLFKGDNMYSCEKCKK